MAVKRVAEEEDKEQKAAPPVGSPQAIIAALRAAPKVSREEVEDLLALIDEGMGPADYKNPLRLERP